jgi:hypothetical protein
LKASVVTEREPLAVGPDEAARLLGVSRSGLYVLMAAGAPITPRKAGGRSLFIVAVPPAVVETPS